MLGAFEDNELEPNEMQDVAFHLARCESCTALLAEYGTIGRELRSIVTPPPLGGFVAAVMDRIENLPVPLTVRTRRFFDRISDHISSGFALGAGVALAAMLTVVIATPYARLMLNPKAPAQQLAKEAPAEPAANIEHETEKYQAPEGLSMASGSNAVISRIESGTSSVAVWSEPQTDTTVIWLPDEP